MQIKRHHMLLGLCAAAAVHAGAGLLFFLYPSPPASEAEPAGMSGIEVSLGSVGGAPDVAKPITEEIVETEALEEVEVEQVELAEVPVETPQPEEVAVQEPEPQPIKPVEQVQAREVVNKTPPRPRPDPVVRESPKAPPQPPPPEAVVQRSNVAASNTAGLSAPETPRANGNVSAKDKPVTGSRDAAPVDTSSAVAARAEYLRELSAWLEQHKQYPRRARVRRQQGTAVLRFTINREGRVLLYEIDESSGYTMLDKEVEAMIKRAQPLPVIPDEMQQASLELVLPVQFFLR